MILSTRQVRRLLERIRTDGAGRSGTRRLAGHRTIGLATRCSGVCSDARSRTLCGLWSELGSFPSSRIEIAVSFNETSSPIYWFMVASIRCLGPVPIESPFFHLIGGNHPRQPKSRRRSCRDYSMFEDRGPPCSLLVFVDDATGKLMQLRFVRSESAFTYFEALALYLRQHGAPVAFYSDKHSVFRVAKKDAKGGQGMTQFWRALCELNIEIFAQIPVRPKVGSSG